MTRSVFDRGRGLPITGRRSLPSAPGTVWVGHGGAEGVELLVGRYERRMKADSAGPDLDRRRRGNCCRLLGVTHRRDAAPGLPLGRPLVRSDASLGGYVGGLHIKLRLLTHVGAALG